MPFRIRAYSAEYCDEIVEIASSGRVSHLFARPGAHLGLILVAS